MSSEFREGGQRTPRLDLAWVDQQHRFLFRGIQKNASTAFNQLFLKLAGDPAYDDPPYHKGGVTYLGELPQPTQEAIIADPDWLRVAVLRDPFERLVSAFLHVVQGEPYPIRREGSVVGHYPQTFDAFLDVITDGGDTIVLSNVHWRPQSHFFPTIDVFNYVVDFANLADQAREVLRLAGIWDEHGERGWGPGRREPFLGSIQHVSPTNASRRREEFARHEPRIRDIYRDDYEVLERVTFGRTS